MSGVEGDEPSTLPATYQVGYKQPPVGHRFQKGQSGNPAGRPRGARNKPRIDTGYGMRPAEQYLREEAYRPIAIREGEHVIELPAIQAVFRAMGVSAMKGNRFAQRTLAELVTRMEEEEHRSRFELFGKAIDYKQSWEEAFELHKKAGLDPPRPIPHPDDIILNPATGDVRIEGPQTKEQLDRLEEALARRAQAQEDVSYFAEKYRRSRSADMKASYLEEWHWEQRMFDILNDIVPRRYKAQLENRSHQKGASRAGKALDELRKNRKLRSEYVG